MSEERLYLWNQTKGKTDREIMDLVNILGKPAVFTEIIMNVLPLELDPKEAKDCVIGFEISADDQVYPWRVEISGGEVKTDPVDPVDADAIIAVSLPNFVRLINEELGGVKAFMQRKLAVKGNPVFAYSIPRMFPFREKEAVS